MKKLSIFCMPSHTFIDRISGVDFLRIIQPMKALKGYKDSEIELDVHVYDVSKGISFDWRDVMKEYDICYFNYSTNDMGYAVMGTMAQKYNCTLICDVDDNIWGILPDNSSYEIFKKGSWGRTVVTAILNDVSYVTCTNRYLKNVILHNTNKKSREVFVFPNHIDLDVYSHKAKKKDQNFNITIGHFGSTSHFNNIANSEFIKALERIMKEYPHVTFTTVGSFFGGFKKKWGARYNVGLGDPDVMKWAKNIFPPLADSIDFFVTPILENPYNLAKSATKYNEASSTARPGVWQNIRQYREVVDDGVNGYLCTTESEWYKAMESLILDSKKRKEMGENAYQKVVDNYQMKDNITPYVDMFKIILDNR